MVSKTLLAAGAAALAHSASAVSVSGTPEGFAASVTGGGDAEAVYPTTTDELYVSPRSRRKQDECLVSNIH